MRENSSHPQPLRGLRVMVTRPEDPDDPLSEQLNRLGAEVVLQPAIRITPPDDWGPVDRALDRLGEFDWIVFSSANGVRYFLERLAGRGGGALGASKLAAIGPGTSEELARNGLKTHLVPEQYRAEALAEALAQNARQRRFLLIRASRGREVLAEKLVAAGGLVEQVVAYASVDVEKPRPEVASLLHSGEIDWITVTSSAIARSLAKMFEQQLFRAKLACISPITSATLREMHYEPAAEAEEYTVAGLVAAIVNAEMRG